MNLPQNEEELLEAMKNGLEVRWLPRHISGKEPEDYDPEGKERDLHVGTFNLTIEQEFEITSMIYDLKKDGKIEEKALGQGITRYFVR